MSDRDSICRFIRMFLETSPNNRITPETALSPEFVGVQIFETEPLVGVAAADDRIFARFREPEVIGPHHTLPSFWVSNAISVVSFFLRFTETIRRANGETADQPHRLWLHGRIEGQTVLNELTDALTELLKQQGYPAVAPSRDSRFFQTAERRNPAAPEDVPDFTSNWSERHAAYACGLGTFGRSRGIITEKGMAGRFSSVITAQTIVVTPRPYTDPYEYCINCGACKRNCPVDAFPEGGIKKQVPCGEKLLQTRSIVEGYYGCGKCQVKVPCEDAIPAPARKRMERNARLISEGTRFYND